MNPEISFPDNANTQAESQITYYDDFPNFIDWNHFEIPNFLFKNREQHIAFNRNDFCGCLHPSKAL